MIVIVILFCGVIGHRKYSRVGFAASSLESEEDVDADVEALRVAFKKQINDNKKITL